MKANRIMLQHIACRVLRLRVSSRLDLWGVRSAFAIDLLHALLSGLKKKAFAQADGQKTVTFFCSIMRFVEIVMPKILDSNDVCRAEAARILRFPWP